jgi:hypothetical protein
MQLWFYKEIPCYRGSLTKLPQNRAVQTFRVTVFEDIKICKNIMLNLTHLAYFSLHLIFYSSCSEDCIEGHRICTALSWMPDVLLYNKALL